jgi:hypothetical protein
MSCGNCTMNFNCDHQQQEEPEFIEYSDDGEPERENDNDEEELDADNMFKWDSIIYVLDKPTDRWNPNNYQPTEYELYMAEISY